MTEPKPTQINPTKLDATPVSGMASRASLYASGITMVSAAIALAVSFDVPISAEQQRALLAFVSAAFIFGTALYLAHKIAGIHNIVNGNSTILEERIAQLENILKDSGVEVPPKSGSSNLQ